MYYTIKALVKTDESKVRDMREFETLDEADVRFHLDLSQSINNCKSILMMVVNEVGQVHKCEHWQMPEPTPEPPIPEEEGEEE